MERASSTKVHLEANCRVLVLGLLCEIFSGPLLLPSFASFVPRPSLFIMVSQRASSHCSSPVPVNGALNRHLWAILHVLSPRGTFLVHLCKTFSRVIERLTDPPAPPPLGMAGPRIRSHPGLIHSRPATISSCAAGQGGGEGERHTPSSLESLDSFLTPCYHEGRSTLY